MNAEFIFRHKFTTYTISNTNQEIIDIKGLFEKFKDINIRNNKELRYFLIDVLDLGEGINFDANKLFATNLRLYSDFIVLIIGICMSCIKGNHRMYTATSLLMNINESFPLHEENDYIKRYEIKDECCIKLKQDMNIISIPYHNFSLKNIIEKARVVSKIFMRSQDTKITSTWDEYMRKTSEKLTHTSVLETNMDMRKHEYMEKKKQKRPEQMTNP